MPQCTPPNTTIKKKEEKNPLLKYNLFFGIYMKYMLPSNLHLEIFLRTQKAGDCVSLPRLPQQMPQAD
jgi:hypothetical protein